MILRTIVLSSETGGVASVVMARPGILVAAYMTLRATPDVAIASNPWMLSGYLYLGGTATNPNAQNYVAMLSIGGISVAAAGPVYTSGSRTTENRNVTIMMPYGPRTTISWDEEGSGVSGSGFSCVLFVQDAKE